MILEHIYQKTAEIVLTIQKQCYRVSIWRQILELQQEMLKGNCYREATKRD